jgi:hypothetical protein
MVEALLLSLLRLAVSVVVVVVADQKEKMNEVLR